MLAVFVPIFMAIVIIIALAYSFQDLRQIQANGDSVRQIRSDITEINHLVFSYILYHQERPKQQFVAEQGMLAQLIASAQVQNADQQRLLDNIREDSTTMNDLFMQLVSTYESAGTPGTVESQGAENDLIDLLLLRSYEADSDASTLRSQIDDGIRVNETRTIGLILLVIILATIPLTIVLIRTRRGITSSLSSLSKGAAIVGSGNIDFKIEEKAKDEVGDLSRAFNKMTTQLKTVTASKTDLEKEIEERKKAQEGLRASEEKWSTTLSSIGDGVIAVNVEGRITFMNAVAEQLTGWSVDEASTMPVTDVFKIINEKTRKTVECPIDRVLKEGIIIGLANHTILVRKDGTEIPIDDSGAPIRGREGNTVGVVLVFHDITENKKGEEALKQSEERLKRSQEIAHLGSWELDLINDRLSWSDEAYRIFGLQPQEFGATYEAFLEAVHPDDRAAVDEAYSSSVREGRDSYEIEHRVVRKSSGEIRYVHEKCTHVRDTSGKIIRSIGMVHDITERKQAEEEIRETRDYLNNLLDYANAPIIVWDPLFRITQFNHAFEYLIGRPGEEVIGEHLDILFPEDSREHSMDHIRQAVAGEHMEVEEIPIQHKDGSIRIVLWNSATLYDLDKKTPTATIAQGQDITDRKKVEEQLRQRAEELETVMNLVPVAIWVAHDPKCNNITGNRTANEFYEAEEGENVSAGPAAGEPIPSRRFFRNGKELTAEELPMQEAAAQNMDIQGSEFNVMLPSGKSRTLWGSASPLRDQDGQVRGVVAAFLDITERKQAEEDLKHYTVELEAPIRNWKLSAILFPMICGSAEKLGWLQPGRHRGIR